MNIYPIRLAINRCYVIQADGTILVDGGAPGVAGAFRRAMDAIPVELDQIGLMVLTHGHADHVGSAREIQAMTGARIAIHHLDRDLLEGGLLVWPSAVTAWGHVLRLILRLSTPLFRFPTTQADVILGDEGLWLAEYGVPGRIVHTPGHTPGSVSVLLETGEAFVGCLAHNNLPFRLRPGLPVFAEDLDALKASWRLVLDQGARTIYPAHGDPFPADVIRKALA
jgi:hydroxyacylglutathione hydrolase